MKSALVAIYILVSMTGYSVGGMDSGGGFTPSISQNPWFFENSRDIKYCINIDEQNFGVTIDTARNSVKRAIQYWESQLEKFNAWRDEPDVPFIKMLPPLTFRYLQEEHLGICQSTTDLIFQLGYLTEDQQPYIPNPKEVIAQAVLTDYDPEVLKGKGFIYISPEEGNLAPEMSQFSHWEQLDGKLLTITLMHELGHVLGIPHLNNGPNKKLMSSRTPWILLDIAAFGGRVSESIDNMFFHENFFSVFPNSFEATSCTLRSTIFSRDLREVLDFKQSRGCLTLQVDGKHVALLHRDTRSSYPKKIFSDQCQVYNRWLNYDVLSEVYLPPEQRIVSSNEFMAPFVPSLVERDLHIVCNKHQLHIDTKHNGIYLSGWNPSKDRYDRNIWVFEEGASAIDFLYFDAVPLGRGFLR